MKERIDIYSFIYKNKNTEYVKKIFALFKKDMGIKGNVSMSSLMDWFVEWIRFNKDMSREFVRQIDDNFVVLPFKVIEVGKGELDTISSSLLERGYDVMSISSYAYNSDSEVQQVQGNLDYSMGEGLVLSKDKITPLIDIATGTLITTLPVDDRIVNAMIRCANNGYSCLIGAYNESGYGNYRDTIKRLTSLKEYIKNQSDLNMIVYDNNIGSQYYNALYVKGRCK